MSSHPIVHIEFSAADREAAGRFYQEIFGWEVRQMPEMNYATFAAPPGPGGGLNPITPENPAGTVLVYIDSDDIEADLDRIAQLGGTVVAPKMEIPGVGWFGMFKDPSGNLLALFTASTP